MKSLKQKLFDACLSHLNDQLKSLEFLIKEIQQSANEETKSSAGDKYETGRAMAQLEIEKCSVQLADVKRMKQDLTRINSTEKSDIIKTGSLVFTSQGNFYIAINTGEHYVDHKNIFAISPAAPIAQKLMGLRSKASFSFNSKEFTILEIQ